jgi:hypothetical protein
MTANQQWWRAGGLALRVESIEFEDPLTSLTGYTQEPGGGAPTVPFSLDVDGLTVGSNSGGTQQYLSLTIPGGAVTINRIYARFRINDALHNDDAGIVQLYNGVTLKFGFNPKRETAIDTARRVSVGVDADAKLCGSTALPNAEWLRVAIILRTGSGQSSIEVTDDLGVPLVTDLIPGTHPDLTVDTLKFLADAGTGSLVTTYDFIRLSYLAP